MSAENLESPAALFILDVDADALTGIIRRSNGDSKENSLAEKRDYEFVMPRMARIIPGTAIGGRYTVKRMLGEGGMSAVYLARDDTLAMDVALKMVHSVLSNSKQAIDALRDEARVTASLSHPNVVRLFNFEQTDNLSFIVVEFVDGPSLQDIMDRQGKLSLEETLRYAESVARGLDYAHECGVLHRDVKPTNIMIDSRGIVKLTDFGIARRMKDQALRLSRELRAGTPPYMAPEQLIGNIVDRRSDIYSFAVVIYECISGTLPFESGSVEMQIMLKPAPPLQNVPDIVRDAVLRALSKSPSQRYNSAGEFFAALSGAPAPAVVEVAKKEPAKLALVRKTVKAPVNVLVVDDEDDIRSLLVSFLKSNNYGYETATNGEEALNAVSRKPFDLIILDLYMPKMNGFQFLRRIRIEGVTTPVVILTASPLEEDMLASYRTGADYFLCKPFSAKRLKDVLAYFLEDISDKEREELESRL
jgi:serine/threonine protein kinase